MSIINRWGADEVQKRFFKRQIEYRKTMDRFVHQGGAKVVEENSMAFKLTNTVKTVEQMTDLAMCRYLAPTLRSKSWVLPQIMGVNRVEQKCFIMSYAPILKAFQGKAFGIVDVLTAILGNKNCDLIGFVAAGNKGSVDSQIAAIAAYDLPDKSSITRAFVWDENNQAIVEVRMPMERFEELFERTFDSDIWVSDEVWTGDEQKGV